MVILLIPALISTKLAPALFLIMAIFNLLCKSFSTKVSDQPLKIFDLKSMYTYLHNSELKCMFCQNNLDQNKGMYVCTL